MTTFDWTNETEKHTVDKLSKDGRWHLSGQIDANKNPNLHIFNYTLACTPMGYGSDEASCLRDFIARCDQFITKVQQAQADAETLLATMADQQAIN